MPRAPDGKPDIPDPRNDLHTIISQLHLAFMRLHNRLAGDLAKSAPEKTPQEIFDDTHRKVCWLYQWLVVNDFLRRLCDEQLMRRLWPRHNLVSPEFQSCLSSASHHMPLEFALAAFRFGHSMARPSYRLNGALPPRPIFRENGQVRWYADLRGHRKLLVRWSVQWDLFLGRDHPGQQYARRITPNIVPSLGRLPAFTIEEEPRHVVNLAERTLKAGNGLLPSGQDVARIVLGRVFPRLGIPSSGVLDPERAEPLWYYVLREAELEGGGLRLGPVGSWIVASTISNALLADKSSFVHAKTWGPDLPVEGNAFELIDLIRYSGMPISHDDWKGYVAR